MSTDIDNKDKNINSKKNNTVDSDNKFFSGFYTLANNIKSGINTVKQDFIEDIKDNYNYIKKTYSEINTQKKNIHIKRIESLRNKSIKSKNLVKDNKIIDTEINNDLVNNDLVNNSADINEYYNNLLSFMIEEKILEQKMYIENNLIERLSFEEYTENIRILKMNNNILKEFSIKSNICSLCQDKIVNGETCCITPCNHLYHNKCCLEWFVKKCIKPQCTLCHKNVLLINNN